MKSSKIGMLKVGTSIVLTLKESLTFNNYEELEKYFNEVIKQNNSRICLDFKSVPFLDSKALELLLRMHDALENRGGALKLFGLNSVCRDILLTTRLIHILHVYQDMNEALRAEL